MTIASHRLFALFFCTLLLAGSAQAAPAITDPVKAGYDLAVRMDQVDTSQDSYSEAVMSINRGGKVLTRSFKTYSKARRRQRHQISRLELPRPGAG